MSGAKHTSGPWEVPEGGIRPMVHAGGGRVLIASMGDTGNEMEANARLIAAAPDLLAALKSCLGMVRIADANSGSTAYSQSRRAAEAAIAKATGDAT